MREVRVVGADANQTMELVRELRSAGLVQGRDFDFSYHQAQYSNFAYDDDTPRMAVFKFYVDKYATFYQLKWS